MNLGIGFRKDTKKLSVDGKKQIVQWRVLHFNRVVAEGASSSEALAEKDMAKALSQKVDSIQKGSDALKEHRKRLKRHLTKRTHLSYGVVQRLMAGIVHYTQLTTEAERIEREQWEADKSKFKQDLVRVGPGRPSLGPSVVVEQMWDSMVALGMIVNEDTTPEFSPKGRKWAREMFGEEAFK